MERAEQEGKKVFGERKNENGVDAQSPQLAPRKRSIRIEADAVHSKRGSQAYIKNTTPSEQPLPRANVFRRGIQ